MLSIILVFLTHMYAVEGIEMTADERMQNPEFIKFISYLLAERNFEKAKPLFQPWMLDSRLFKTLTHIPDFIKHALTLKKHNEKWLLKALTKAAKFGNLDTVNILLQALQTAPKILPDKLRDQYFLQGLSYAAKEGNWPTFEVLQPHLPYWYQMQFEGKFAECESGPLELMGKDSNLSIVIALIKHNAYLNSSRFARCKRFIKEKNIEGSADFKRYSYPVAFRMAILCKEQLWAAKPCNRKSIFHTIKQLGLAPLSEKAEMRKKLYAYLAFYPLLVTPHLRDLKGNTLLHTAVQINDLELFIHLYLLNRSLIQYTNNHGITPLALALGEGHSIFTHLFNIAHSNQVIKTLPSTDQSS